MESEHDIFWRGPTPSILEGEEIAFLMDTIREEFEIEGEAEISIECNPGTVDEKKLKLYREAGNQQNQFWASVLKK